MDQCAAFECVFEIYFSLKQSPPLSGQFFQHQGGQLRENIFRSETWVKGGGGDCTHLKCTFGRVVALHPSAPHLWWDYPSSEYPRSRSMESQRSHIPKKTSPHTGTRTFICYLIVVCTEVKKFSKRDKIHCQPPLDEPHISFRNTQ